MVRIPNEEIERRRQRETLRRRFLPSRLRMLFIGESAPASGRFFYRADSGLYRAMRDAFRAVDPGIGEDNFLSAFKEAGCYLIDLCADPVDQLPADLRRAVCLASEPRLTRAIRRLRPGKVATVVRSIEDNVARSLSRAQWQGEVIRLPYPGRWARHRELFMERLVSELRGG
jgi:hypothetical protein